uniref:Uncharacterized protein n=1 Tax=Arundo donax TaxID=35708 RepID=A0A0A8ZW53_ARUDO
MDGLCTRGMRTPSRCLMKLRANVKIYTVLLSLLRNAGEDRGCERLLRPIKEAS